MTGLLRSEWRKVFSVKAWWILLLSAAAFTILQTLVPFLLADEISRTTGQNPLETTAGVNDLVASAGAASVFVLILGILGMTTEYRHMTITSTFLTTPRRWRVLATKMGLYVLLGALFGLAMFAVAYVTTMVGLSTFSGDFAAIDNGKALQVLGGIVLAFAIYAVVGVSVGALLRNQVAAIVIALVWVMLVEALIGVFFDWVGKWLPGGALNAVLQISGESNEAFTGSATDMLSPGVGALVLLAYGIGFAALASFTTLRRDIT